MHRSVILYDMMLQIPETYYMSKAAYLYFHSPCFDGIVSSVLTWDFLESYNGSICENIYAVNYDARASWLSTELETPCAVVDFLYHPQAQFWADHHLTTFLTEEAKKDFDQRKSSWLIYDERSGSCAALLWNHLAASFNYRNQRYKIAVEWADKIDSARYDSVHEAIFGDEPALRINLSLVLKNGKAYSEELVRMLRHETLDNVAQLPEVKERYEQARDMIQAGLNLFADRYKLERDDIVVFDVDTNSAIISRYAPYYFYPHARYSAGIIRSTNGASITVMRNPWCEFPSVFLGKIAEKFGGGGHQRVGAILLRDKRAKDAGLILEQVLAELRKEERRKGLSHDTEF